jgi:hypothetical protein
MSKKHEKRYYTIDRKRYETFAKATEYAVGMAIESGEDVTITEHGTTGTYYITVRAQAEEAE